MNIVVASAPLPLNYQEACRAIVECERLDECKAWDDKAQALASYAKQSKDETLLRAATRIHLRALNQCGELLKEHDGRPANASKQTEAGRGLISQRAVADAAGLSEHQQLQAVRIANVPAEVRESLIESDTPPTAKELAKLGTRPQANLDYLQGREPETFNRILHFVAGFEATGRLIADFSADLETTLPAMTASERTRLLSAFSNLDNFMRQCREGL